MKKILLLFFTFSMISALATSAQNGVLAVDTFYLAIGDARATGRDAVMDFGEPPRPCALIIVHLPLEGATVEKNRLGIREIKNMPNNEIWVYAPAGVGGPDRLVVKHPNYQDLTVELEDWLESDGEGYLSAATVYHLRIHVPSAMLTMAEQKLSNFDFNGANEYFEMILNDSSLDVHERHFAKERTRALHDWDKMLSLAQKYEKKYVTDKSKAAEKSQIISDLDSIIHWYDILYEQSRINKAEERMKAASVIRNGIVEKTIITVKFRLLEIKNKSQYVELKPQQLQNIDVEIIKKKKKLSYHLPVEETDGNGVGQFSVEYSPEIKFKFTYQGNDKDKDGNYKVYTSNVYEVSGDKIMTVFLKLMKP